MPASYVNAQYYRCGTCFRILITVRLINGDIPPGLTCPTGKCGGGMTLYDEPTHTWPASVNRVATAVWSRPDSFTIRRRMQKSHPKLYRFVYLEGGLLLSESSYPIPLRPDEPSLESNDENPS